jgi:YidC/Oxa1 family membrane protein insertase
MTMLVPANIFQPLISVFEAVLKFFHNSVGVPWGWAIVLLTVCVRLVLMPLMLKQFHSMQALQRLQPEMKKIQAKYKDDKQRQQQEMMKFYRENNVNPMGSCLPMVAQLPVFISLYYMLKESLRGDICPGVQHAFQASYAAAHHVSLHAAAGQTTYCTNPTYAHFYHGGAGFLFIPDLTNTATGAVLVVLILLYVGTQLASSLLMATPTMDPTQRKIMLVMPLFFVLFIIRFPAGVLVYWITTNTWTMGQQYLFRRRIAHLQPATAAGGLTAGGGNGAAVESGNGGGSTGGIGALIRTVRGKPAEVQNEPAKVGAGSSEVARASRSSAKDGGGSSDAGGKGNGGKSGSRGGSGSTGGSGGSGSGQRPRRAGSTPPPSPRKRKKRSGRRR